ncbi:MAG TPA: DMT family transporter [Stellaceae bacterium]|nr:DMT family transporter [Stellaceae bacterium]
MANQQNIGRAIVYMALAMSLLPCLNASAKYLGHSYSTVEVVWARYAGHFAYMIIVFFPRRGSRLFSTSRLSIQVLRSALLLGSTALYFTALNYTDLPTAASISFSAPIMITALSPFMLGETVGPRRWAAVGVGFLGALLILRPGSGAVPVAGFLVVLSAACNAFYQLLTRSLAARDSAETSNTYIALVGFVLSSLAVPFVWQAPRSLLDLLLFVGLGIFGGFGHYFIVKALEWGPAAVIAPLNYGQLVGAVTIGYVVFAEWPDGWTWAGAAVIIGSGLYIFYRERRLQQRVRPAEGTE